MGISHRSRRITSRPRVRHSRLLDLDLRSYSRVRSGAGKSRRRRDHLPAAVSRLPRLRLQCPLRRTQHRPPSRLRRRRARPRTRRPALPHHRTPSDVHDGRRKARLAQRTPTRFIRESLARASSGRLARLQAYGKPRMRADPRRGRRTSRLLPSCLGQRHVRPARPSDLRSPHPRRYPTCWHPRRFDRRTPVRHSGCGRGRRHSVRPNRHGRSGSRMRRNRRRMERHRPASRLPTNPVARHEDLERMLPDSRTLDRREQRRRRRETPTNGSPTPCSIPASCLSTAWTP